MNNAADHNSCNDDDQRSVNDDKDKYYDFKFVGDVVDNGCDDDQRSGGGYDDGRSLESACGPPPLPKGDHDKNGNFTGAVGEATDGAALSVTVDERVHIGSALPDVAVPVPYSPKGQQEEPALGLEVLRNKLPPESEAMITAIGLGPDGRETVGADAPTSNDVKWMHKELHQELLRRHP